MKVCLVCSTGGHLAEMLCLLPALEEHEHFIVTYDDPYARSTKDVRYFLPSNIREKPQRLLFQTRRCWDILRRESPQVIISTGAEIALPFFYLGRVLGMHTIFIESWCRTSTASLTGRLAYPVANEFLVMWPALLEVYGPKARYEGAIL